MKQFYLTLAFVVLAAAGAFAQFNATVKVTDFGTGLPVQNASVSLDGNVNSTDASGEAVFSGLADGTYDYSVSATCYYPGAGSVTIAGADASSSLGLDALTTNNLFFFIGDPLAIIGATVQVTNGAGYDSTFVTTDTFGGERLDDVPFGEIVYTITTPCYETVSGTVTVDCNNGDGIAVFTNPTPTTRNNLFFFIGDPLAIIGSTVEVTDGADYNESFVTSDPFGGEMLADVPFGEYSYTITTPCYETVSGTVTVDCNNGDGIAVFTNPAPSTRNNLFFFIGDPLAIIGSTVEVTDGADINVSFVTSDPFGGEMLADVPFGEYSYTITTPCYETVSGTVTVDCNNGDGIAVFTNPAPMTMNNLFFFIGDPLAIVGATVQVTNGAGYDTSFVTTDTFGGEMLGDVPFGEIGYTITTPCFETVSGTVTVDCNNGDGIAVFTNPAPIVIDATVTLVDNTLTATAAGMDYQWVDCDNSNAPIIGAIGQSFEATESGNYAVIVSDGDCSQTSECTTVIVTGLEELQGANAFAVYPIPFGDQLTVHADGTVGPVRAELFNLSGQLLLDVTRNGMEISLPTTELPSGSYILRLTSDTARTTMSVVK